jgi:hypothetical protein
MKWLRGFREGRPMVRPTLILVVLLLLLIAAAGAMSPGSGTRAALLEPPDGRTYHGIQTIFGGHLGYLAALEDSTIFPAVRGHFLSVPGTRPPATTFSGLRSFLASADSFGFTPEVSLFLVTSNESPTGATDSIIAVTSQYDAFIDSIVVISHNHNKRMFVRIGGEFNGWWNGGGYHPYYYVGAFRKITDRYAALGFRDSIATVWCYEPDGPDDFDSVGTLGPLWYPGDTYVDWFGLDVFDAEHFDQELPDYRNGVITKKGKSERFLAMARAQGKPVYLNETSAKGVTLTADSLDSVNDWHGWFAKFWVFMDNHVEIKGFNYINQDWESTGYPGWGDARIQNSNYITSWYREEMRRPKYIHLHEGAVTSVGAGSDVTGRLIPAQIHPNPCSMTTSIRFSLPSRVAQDMGGDGAGRRALLRVFDVLGREVAALESGPLVPGAHELTFSASGLGSGVYFCHLSVGSSAAAIKLVVVR